ncbi:MAG: discoidin domain-containing protein [Candidatus Latescibacterota bacterium]|nr:discoidin domain-containing protein [Candidatus Latescibacterota bacterium]
MRVLLGLVFALMFLGFGSAAIGQDLTPAVELDVIVDLSLDLTGYTLVAAGTEEGSGNHVVSPQIGNAYDLTLFFSLRDVRDSNTPIYIRMRGNGYSFLYDLADSLETQIHQIGAGAAVRLPVFPKVTDGPVWIDLVDRVSYRPVVELDFVSVDYHNLALGRPYVFSEPANYKETRDAGDTTQLTDGQTKPFPDGFVGWSYAASGVVEVTVDLGKTHKILLAGVRVRGGGLHSAHFPNRTTFLVSTDGLAFSEAGSIANSMLPELQPGAIYSWLAVPVESPARYVRLSFDRRNYIIIDEIVLGVSKS